MHYIDINKRYTAIIAEYLAKGYTINTGSMGGTQSDRAHIDLTNGDEIIRIMIHSFRERVGNIYLGGLDIIVGQATDDVEPNSGESTLIIWNEKLDIISRERFYTVGNNHGHGNYYGTKEEAVAAEQKRIQRSSANSRNTKIEFSTPKALEIAKRMIRQKTGVKRIRNADVRVFKDVRDFKHVTKHIEYFIAYKEMLFVLH